MNFKVNVFLGRLIFNVCNISTKLVSQYLTYRFLSSEGIIGADSQVNGFGKLSGKSNFSAGRNVHIGNNFFFRAEGGLSIGDNTHISHNVSIYTINHNYHGERLPYDDSVIKKSVTIEKNVWIGTKVVILPGTYIEEGAIIGAGSVVSGRVLKGEILGASRANVIKHRKTQHYEDLERIKAYGGVNGKKLDNE